MKLVVAALLAGAVLAPQDAPKDDVAELAKELRAAWTGILELCREGKTEDVRKAIAAMELTRAEFDRLFGAEKGAKLHEAYRDAWQNRVLAQAAQDLVDRTKRTPWNEVEAWCLNSREDKDLAEEDRAVLAALADRAGSRVFNVRLKRQDAREALVLRCFVKTDAGWKMGLRLGRTLTGK